VVVKGRHRPSDLIHDPAVGQPWGWTVTSDITLISKSIGPQECPDEPVLVTTLIEIADIAPTLLSEQSPSRRRFQGNFGRIGTPMGESAFSARQPQGDYQNPVMEMRITLVKTAVRRRPRGQWMETESTESRY
jgi:hypothetical protein